MTRLASPMWLFLFVPLALWLFSVTVNRIQGVGSFEFPAAALRPRRTTLRVILWWVPHAIALAGLSLALFALARPQQVFTFTDERKGIDIVIVLDNSGSMAAEDFAPHNRFVAAKDLIQDFIRARGDDRIGIVTFGARAATRVPITFDHEIVRMVLDKAMIGENGDGTAIGHAVATAVNRLRDSEAQSRIIILLTDGVHNAGSIEPMTAAGIAAEMGIRVYTIGVGSEGTVLVPIQEMDPLTGRIGTRYVMAPALLDEKVLEQMAAMTGGEFFRAADAEALQQVFRTIDVLEKTALEAPKITTIKELYERPMLIAIALIAFAVVLGETVWMRLPA